MMNRRAIILIAGIAAVGALLVMVSLYTQTLADNEATRAPADYVGIDVCKNCHPGQYAEWETTAHAIDFANNWTYHGNITNKYTLYGGSCASCHVLGYNETANGGYDPAQAWNSSYNTPLLGIQCESCHGPGSDHPGSDPASTINLMKDPYAESCGGSPEQGCHSGYRQFGNETIHGWNASAHAPWDNRAQAEPGGLNTYCASCKSPSQFDPTATYGTADPIAKDDWRGITCGDCHDPHSETTYEHQLRWSPEEICGTCHTSGGGTSPGSPHHATKELREGITGSEVGAPFMGTVACPDCHMWSSDHGAVPYLQGHSFEPRAEACESCHAQDGVNPELTITESQTHIDDWVAETEAALHDAEEALEEAEAFYTSVSENGTASDHTLTIAGHMLDNASFDVHLIESGIGVHNPAYTLELMESAIEKAETVMEILEAPDVVTGLTAVDAENGKVTLSWSVSSEEDFAHYNIYMSESAITDVSNMEPVGTVFNASVTTYTVAGLEGGTEYNFVVTAVDLDGNEIPTGLSSASATPSGVSGGDVTGEIPIWIWAVIAILAILAVLGLVMAAKGRGGGAMPEEEEELAPEPEAPMEEERAETEE